VQQDWTRAIPAVQNIINNTENKITGYSPHDLLLGPSKNLNKFNTEKKPFPKEGTIQWWEELNIIHENILKKATALQKELDEQNIKLRKSDKQVSNYEIDDYVLISYPKTLGNGRGRAPTKLHTVLKGPVKLVDKAGDKYTTLNLVTRRTEVVHVSRIFPFFYDSTRTDPERVAYLDRGEFKVEKIIDSSMDLEIPKDQWSFLVRWAGYEADDDLWLPWEELKDVEALHTYLREQGLTKLIPSAHRKPSDRKTLPKKVTFSPEIYAQEASNTSPTKRRKTKR